MSDILFKLMAVSFSPPPADTTPDAFSFTDVSNVATSSSQNSSITVAGLGTGVNASITLSGAGQYTILRGSTVLGPFASGTASTVQNSDQVTVGHSASGSNSTAVNSIITIGGVSDTFTSTTEAPAADVTPNALNWNNIMTANSNANTNSQTVTGINAAITLRVDFDEDRDNYTLQANVNGTLVGNAVSSPGNFSFSVSNNDVVYFRAVGGETRDSTADVTNTSDGGATIDSFMISMEE